MVKKILFMVAILAISSGCGKKSKIQPMFAAVKLSESHGDGQYTVFRVKVPLSEKSIDSYDSPVDPSGVRVAVLGDFLRSLTRSMSNFGASMGLGKQLITIEQPLPDLETEYVKSISIKRVFFHIDEKNAAEPVRPRLNLWQRFRRFIQGSDELDFNFIRELKIRATVFKKDMEHTSWMPDVQVTEVDNRQMSQWSDPGREDQPRTELLRYKRKGRSQYLLNKNRGDIFVISTKNPVDVKNELLQLPEVAANIQETILINKSILVELKKGRLSRDKFFQSMQKHASLVDRLEINKINVCNDRTCMDVKVAEENLHPILVSGNRLKIETYLDASRIPNKSFQLKGFIEFEVKLDVPL